MKKAMRKLIPSIIMLLISAMFVGTSTYAWFSLNNKVTVTGMTATTKVSENLLIANDTLESTAKAAESSFKNSLVQEASGLLEPVSTINGTSFFYSSSKNVDASGAPLNNSFIAYAAGDTFDGNYGLDNTNSSPDAVGYIDYVFQIKAINGANAAEIRLTKLALTYGGTADAGKAYRVAMFAEDITNNAPGGSVGTLKSILTESGAHNFSYASESTDKAVDSTSTKAAVTYNTAAKIDIAANTTKYYKVVIRLWLEGEDTTCNNGTYMDLTDSWALDLQFDLVAASESRPAYNAVQSITKNVTDAKVALVTSDAVNSSSNTVVINGVTYYEITGKTLNAKQLYATVTTLTTSSKVYIIEDGTYVTEVTNQVSITTAP